MEINYGEEHTIELKKPQEGIVWETENPDIVTVQDGIVTGIAPGNAIVTAAKDGKTVAEISVSVNIIDISAILLPLRAEKIHAIEARVHFLASMMETLTCRDMLQGSGMDHFLSSSTTV